MQSNKYYLYLSAEERAGVLKSLFALKNKLIEQGRYTDAVDDVLCKLAKASKKKVTIKVI